MCYGTLPVRLDYAFTTAYVRLEFLIVFDSRCENGYGCRGKDGQRITIIKCSQSALREN